MEFQNSTNVISQWEITLALLLYSAIYCHPMRHLISPNTKSYPVYDKGTVTWVHSVEGYASVGKVVEEACLTFTVIWAIIHHAEKRFLTMSRDGK